MQAEAIGRDAKDERSRAKALLLLQVSRARPRRCLVPARAGVSCPPAQVPRARPRRCLMPARAGVSCLLVQVSHARRATREGQKPIVILRISDYRGYRAGFVEVSTQLPTERYADRRQNP